MADGRSLEELRADLEEAAQRLQQGFGSDAARWVPEGVALVAAATLTRTVLPALQVLITEIEALRRRVEAIANPALHLSATNAIGEGPGDRRRTGCCT